MLNTRGIFEQKYGYFEMRAALPTAQGSWPAFWMVPNFNVRGVEADITENLATSPNIDYIRGYGGGGSGASFANVLKTGDPSGFHTYGMLWTPQTVTWFYDDQAVFQAPTPATWDSPMYPIVNYAVGGFGGNPNPGAFPDGYQIDYVRAYALGDGSSIVNHFIGVQDTDPNATGPGPTPTTGPSPTGTSGSDNLQASAAQPEIHGGAGDDTITGWSGASFLTGDDGNDVINGGSGFDRINGNAGNDTVHGGAGDDVLSGGKNDDVVIGDAGNDLINGNLGNDVVRGAGGDDTLRGGQGDDQVFGGLGADYLSGDLGNDTMTGGAGADVFRAFAGGGADVITDFNRAEGDLIRLDPGTTYNAVQSGADVIVSLSGGAQLTLQNVQLSSLTPGWIV
jgi:Ca2+-binding RTX toxin-like protein